MTSSLARTVVVLLGISLASPFALGAQQAPRPSSLDFGAGLSSGGGGGVRHHRAGVAFSGVLALGPREHGWLALALSGALQGPVGTNDMCVLTPQGGCAPDYPWIRSVGALAGVQASRGDRESAVRLLAGPAMYSTAEGFAAGMNGRVDVATPMLGRVAGTLWAHGGIIPRLNGERLQMGAMGLGLRFR